MKLLRSGLTLLIVATCLLAQAQDRLLLTNGKIKTLKGTVVYYDHSDVLYQNDAQRKRMKAYISKKEKKRKTELESGDSAAKNTARIEAEKRQEEKGKAALAQRLADFEENVKIKMEQLSPADFEKWKTRELDRIKSLEQERELNATLNMQLADEKINRKEAKEREKFTTRVARDLVFSILKSDSTEVIVYNADTLGFFGDGEAEVEYGVLEMRAYIQGQQDGRKHKTTFDVLMGVAVGAISAGAGAYWGPSIPAGYIIVTSIANTKIKNKAGVDQALLDNAAYRDGYERAAKRKKTWSFVKGAVGGMAFGILMWDGIVRGEGLPGPR